MTTLYECDAEGHTPHYATEAEAEASILALLDDPEFAGVDIMDIYAEIDPAEAVIDSMAWNNSSPAAQQYIVDNS